MSNLTIQSACPAYDPTIDTQYGYVPSLAAGVTFVVLFGTSFFLHIAQSTWFRTWWGYIFAVGALTEVIGWAGRTWSAVCPYNNNAFLIQISTLIIAPTFFTAGIYVILGRLISLQGPHTSPISPKIYLWIFCTCDFISLVVQAVGGGLASDASSIAGGDTKPGTDIMVAGILFQMASITIFTVLGVNFLISARNDVFPLKLKLLVVTTSLSVVMIFARSVYRSIELLQGWSGFLIMHEGYFIALDGALMVVAVGCFNLLHPSWLLKGDKDQDVREFSMKPSLKDDTIRDEWFRLGGE